MPAIDFVALMKAERAKALKDNSGNETSNTFSSSSTNASATNTSSVTTECTGALATSQHSSVHPALPQTLTFSSAGFVPLHPPSSTNLAYYPSFLTSSEATALLSAINLTPAAAWSNLPHSKRSVLEVSATPGVLQGVLGVEPPVTPPVTPPPHIHGLISLLTDALRPLFPETHPPNHFLINRYAPANNGVIKGILPHTDGPMYHPLTMTLSLGNNARMLFTTKLNTEDIGLVDSAVIAQVLLEEASLCCFRGGFYQDMLHEIRDTMVGEVLQGGEGCVNGATKTVTVEDRERVSVTVRHKFG
jgi:alkylated DNA repair protein alkB family protein 6